MRRRHPPPRCELSRAHCCLSEPRVYTEHASALFSNALHSLHVLMNLSLPAPPPPPSRKLWASTVWEHASTA